MEPNEPAAQTREKKPPSLTFYVFLAAGLYVVIHAHTLLSPILLSFILIVLITLAVNPIILRMRSWTGGRK
ncbi:MAG: AI-2E family transporter, partial [Verrucomicrobiota bacterium]